jgi:signal transduction histidine kinase
MPFNSLIQDEFEKVLKDGQQQTHQIEILQESSGEDSSTSNKFSSFTLKTVKVEWDKYKDSCLHLFINTTAISKFETEKARNKCQKIMFASMSHEFRTPLNAINAAF